MSRARSANRSSLKPMIVQRSTLQARVREAVRAHFDEGRAPKLIRLHFVRDEVIPV
jgi:hypothetical protein